MSRGNQAGQLYGKYRATIANTTHPLKHHKAKVRLIPLWDEVPEKDLPWAEYLGELGARTGEGEAMPCKVGDLVWVEFPCDGDSREPLIVGSCYRVKDEKSELPLDLIEPTYKHKRSEGEPPPPNATYGDRVLDLFGILEQITMNGEWCLTHKPSGTALNVTKDGHLVAHSEKDAYRSSVGDTTEQVGGALVIKVVGPSNIKSDSDVTVEAKGHADIKGSTVTVKSKGDMLLDAGGDLMFKGKSIGARTGSNYDFK
ncbi:phage baseplate assembly protein V [Aliivibrio salmonicida]|uniref:phage baseplate assembly protein V n=1 Tax=Aliivibrio salmonicida TaxID=40269 RepID=UPI003D0DEA6C